MKVSLICLENCVLFTIGNQCNYILYILTFIDIIYKISVIHFRFLLSIFFVLMEAPGMSLHT